MAYKLIGCSISHYIHGTFKLLLINLINNISFVVLISSSLQNLIHMGRLTKSVYKLLTKVARLGGIYGSQIDLIGADVVFHS